MLRRAGLLAALTALLVPAVAGTATADAAKRSKKRSPVVKKVSPSNAFVGEKLTIRGRHFRRGVNKNTVAFKARGKKVVFAKVEKGTTKLLKLTLPKRLEKGMNVQNGTRVPTRMRVRVLSARFGKRFTKLSRSPVIGPEKPPAPDKPIDAAPSADCDGDGLINAHDADDDNDLLADTLEKSVALDPCRADHDEDGVEDGYEYASARDLNDDEYQNPGSFVPYPAKKPYPNPLDGTDRDTDHDGDSLTLGEEFDLWKYTIAAGTARTLSPLSYSAGMQYSVYSLDGTRRKPALRTDEYTKQADFLDWANESGYLYVELSDVGALFGDSGEEWWEPREQFHLLDFNRSGGDPSPAEQGYSSPGSEYLNDAERDEDADGLPNWWEQRGCIVPDYWKALYKDEKPFPVEFAGTEMADGDTDGDGIRDGADDQDHDDVPNLMECFRSLAAAGAPAQSAQGAVQPFNPCMPHLLSRACTPYVVIGAEWAPFHMTEYEILQ
jgi:IPT/TIG domain-containing protein